ncbi:F-box/FBD/LRR-repeat protein [Camellia lanceoleosa]|uniref:F-box/FBD/LRR-repeat protein n=1 Tax=Camellia lanceoleosa TaxID=1840588 RepID=A0ACC0GHA0_9ERIC|nr:F-box/FBD/LRR-repeat protein [Camellia lanceoleosa]
MIDCSRDNVGMETRETRDSEEDDRISNLPDSLLIHILSFLETRYAIRCSILSTKWRNLWASVPNLIFHINSLSNRYSDFIDRVLLVHDLPQILSFTFTGRSWVDIEPNRFNSWICAAIKRRVRDIHVDFSNEFPIQSLNFPRSFFSCETLVNLTLGFEACIISNLPNSTYFPNLKSLKICVAHPNDSLTPTLFSCCPLLEILYLRVRFEWTVHKQVVFNISTQSLRVFRLYLNEARSHSFDCIVKHKVVIDAPLLEDILLDDNFMACYSINNLSSSLEIAHVDVRLQHIYAKLMECDCANRALELVRGISQAKSLHLSFNTLQVLGCAEDIGQLTLWNLTRLELGVIYLSKVMLDLLSKMPNLESLKLIMGYDYYYGNDEEKEFYRIRWHVVPYCLLSHLKVIEIDNFRGWENDLLLVEYFLKNAKVLNKMAIKHQNSYSFVNVEVLKRITMFPRGSERCEIEIEDLISNLPKDHICRYETNKESLVEFEINDFVWAILTEDRFPTSEYNKLAIQKIGPLEVVEKINSNAYRLKLPSHIPISDVFNIKHLIRYHEDSYDEEPMNSRENSLHPRDDDAIRIAEKYMATRDHRKAQ